MAINWQIFGSNGLEKADYFRGVLERFTRRAPKDWSYILHSQPVGGNPHIKTTANPRAIDFYFNPHMAVYFKDKCIVNENGKVVSDLFNKPVTAEKIAVNHYYGKSREEFANKMQRGRADIPAGNYTMKTFDIYDRNEVFDDGILKYRAARAENFSLESDAERFNRVTAALTKTLSAYADGEIFSLETALTCRAVSAYLRENFPADDYWKVCEEASLAALLKSIEGASFADVQLFIRELPELLRLPYPVVKDLRGAGLQVILQLKEFFYVKGLWKEFVEMDYIYMKFLRSDSFD